MTRLKLAIGIPAYGDSLTAHHARMWLEVGNILGASTERFGLASFHTVDVNPVDVARSQLLARAVAIGADWLLMIDADTWVEGYGDEDAGFCLLRMISDADRAGAAIVAAPVAARICGPVEPFKLMVYNTAMESTRPGLLEPIDPKELDGKRSLVEVSAAATAVFAVRVPFVTEHGMFFKFNTDRQLSEDLAFCLEARAHGGRVMVDPRVRTGHKTRPYALYNTQEAAKL